MAKVSELLTMLEGMVGDEVDPITALRWFNECNDILSAEARVRTTKTAGSWAGGETYSLPSDFLELVEVRYGEDADNLTALYDLHLYPHRSYGFRLWGTTLQFSEELDAGVLEVDYFKRLDELELDLAADPVVDSEPEIPVQFHRLYALFGASRYWSHWNDEEDQEQMRRAEFEAGKMELSLYTMTQGKYAPFRTRDVLPRKAREHHNTDDDWDEFFEV